MTVQAESADTLKTLNLAYYVQQHCRNNQRDDGRPVHGNNVNDLCRKITVSNSTNSLSHCYGQSYVTQGNTAILCGVTLEIGKLSEVCNNNVDARINVELSCSPACNNSKYTRNKIDDNIIALNQQLNNIVQQSRCIDYSVLNIMNDSSDSVSNLEQYCYVLYVDLVCINDDGNLLDCALLAVVAALQNTRLPQSTQLDRNTNELFISRHKSDTALQLSDIPVATTFAILSDGTILVDGTYTEECVAIGSITVCATGNDNICYINKVGVTEVTDEEMQRCIQLATQRQRHVASLIKR